MENEWCTDYNHENVENIIGMVCFLELERSHATTRVTRGVQQRCVTSQLRGTTDSLHPSVIAGPRTLGNPLSAEQNHDRF